MAMRNWAAMGLVLLAGCASDGETAADGPGPAEAPAPPAAVVPPPLPPPPPEHDPGQVPAGWGALDPAVDGESILPGVVLLGPALDAAGAASFRVRNDAGMDLPDLILAVVFGVPTGDPEAPHRPRIETVEAPLGRGEERGYRVPFPGRGPGERPDRFRVAAGLPEMLTAGEGEAHPGTTFLGGLLECVRLEVDLTSETPRVTVGLAERGAVPPALETRLFLARNGAIVWSGPWILLPRPGGEGPRERGVAWRLPRDLPAAGCALYLRVRERR